MCLLFAPDILTGWGEGAGDKSFGEVGRERGSGSRSGFVDWGPSEREGKKKEKDRKGKQ